MTSHSVTISNLGSQGDFRLYGHIEGRFRRISQGLLNRIRSARQQYIYTACGSEWW